MSKSSKPSIVVERGNNPYVSKTEEETSQEGAEGAEEVTVVNLPHSKIPLEIHPRKAHRGEVGYFQKIAQRIRAQVDANDIKKLQHVSLMIATPAYANQVTVPYMHSLLVSIFVLEDLGVRCEPIFIGTESLIPRARNGLLAEFIGSDATHFLFIDADVGFQPASIIRLLLSGKDVISAVYPLKCYKWDRIIKFIQKLSPKAEVDVSIMKDVCAGYVFNVAPRRHQIYENKGYLEVLDAPTGFMMLTRKIVSFLVGRYANLKFMNDVETYDTPRSKGNFYALFNTIIDPKTRRFLSEDYAFSRLCQLAGVPVWIDIMNPLTHTGVHTWQGHLGRQLMMMHECMHAEQQCPEHQHEEKEGQ